MDEIFDLFDRLGATEEQLDFPVIYASALNGIAGDDPDNMADDMSPLFQMIVDHVQAPNVELDGPFQMQVSALDYDSFVGVIGVGRITRGKLKPGTDVQLIDIEGKVRKGRIQQVKGFHGLNRVDVEEAAAGDIRLYFWASMA